MRATAKKISELVTVGLALALSACGGGNTRENYESACSNGNSFACEQLTQIPGPGSPATPTGGNAEGLYFGTTDTARKIFGIVLDDGRYYITYSPVQEPNFIAGAIQGSASANGGSFTSQNGRDFSIESDSVTDVTLSASHVLRTSLNGTITYPSNGAVTFTSTYDADSETIPTLASVAGTYIGESAVGSNIDPSTVTISSTGVLHGRGVSGCAYNGQATPRAKAGLYDITIRLGPPPCVNANSTVTGVMYYRSSTEELVAIGTNSTRTDGFLLLADRAQSGRQ